MAYNRVYARGPSQSTTPRQQSDPLNSPFDIAKLADEPLLTESFPYCCLAFRDVAEAVRMPAWLKKFASLPKSVAVFGLG